MCKIYIHILSTHSVLLDILTVINTHYTPYVHILHWGLHRGHPYSPVCAVSTCQSDLCKPVWTRTLSSHVKLSFIVIPLHVGTYSGTKRCASQDHGAT